MWSTVVAMTVQPVSRIWQRPLSRSITYFLALSNSAPSPRA
jgi:hypothetical protein